MNKIDEFSATVYSINPDIIGVTESWATDKVLSSELNLSGYVLFRHDRPVKRHAGGVLLYVKSVLKPVEFNPKSNFPEHVWCKITGTNNDELLIGVCYRTENADIFGDVTHQLMRDLLNEVGKSRILLMGDFNYKDVVWNNSVCYGTPGASLDTRLFCDCILDNFLTQHVFMPTRGENILDLVFSSEPDLVSNVQVINGLADSDHCMLLYNMHMKSAENMVSKIVFDYNKGDFESFKQELQKIDWCSLFQGDVLSCWSIFKTILLDLESKYIHKRILNSNAKGKKPIWMTRKVGNVIKRKRKVFARHRDRLHPAVVDINKKCKKLIKKAKINFEQKLALNIKHDSKSFFAYARSKTKSKVNPAVLIDSEGQKLETPLEVSEEFNKYFSTVFTAEDSENIPEPNIMYSGCDADRVSDCEFTLEHVKKKLSKVRLDKATGADDISPRLIFHIKDEICEPLYMIFRKSLDEGLVPDDWRRANVSPLYKSGSRVSVENYRPVSLTSQICKLFESLIRDVLVEHLERHQILLDSQHGFRKGRSCLTNLLIFLEQITNCVEDGDSVDVIFLDFAKAFDKVPHQRLLKKLNSHGIYGKLYEWIKSWLSHRMQRVYLNGSFSEWRNVLSGVPQGSVLGPILFLIYINDLDSGVMNWILKFADDTKIFSKINNLKDGSKLQNDLQTLIQWSIEWQMHFNFKKCKVMHIGSNNLQLQYFMSTTHLDSVDSEKDLGVVISSDLKVSNQCIKAYAKANKILGVINRTIESKSVEIMIKLYKTLVRPHVEYCTAVWSPYYSKDKLLIEKIQRRFTKMIVEVKNLSYEERLMRLQLWSLEERRNRADLIEVFKMLKGLSSVSYGRFFNIASDGKTRGHSLKLVKKRFSTSIRQHFFSERVINRWNSLDEDTVSVQSLNGFKKRLNMLRATKKGLFVD